MWDTLAPARQKPQIWVSPAIAYRLTDVDTVQMILPAALDPLYIRGRALAWRPTPVWLHTTQVESTGIWNSGHTECGWRGWNWSTYGWYHWGHMKSSFGEVGSGGQQYQMWLTGRAASTGHRDQQQSNMSVRTLRIAVSVECWAR